jgi:hypothetical protein
MATKCYAAWISDEKYLQLYKRWQIISQTNIYFTGSFIFVNFIWLSSTAEKTFIDI